MPFAHDLSSLDLSNIAAPIALRPAVPMTDEELMLFSEMNSVYKIERNNRGEITIMTPAGGTGSTHELLAATALANWTDSTGTGVPFASSVGFNLPDGSCLSPDAAWLSLARWNALTPDEQSGFPPLCPEFIIEVRSRSDSRRLLENKMPLWLDNGAQLAWLIDPAQASVTIYRPEIAAETLDRPENIVAGPPVEGFSLPASRLWPAL